jgi:CBS-domain-containing membrane protein
VSPDHEEAARVWLTTLSLGVAYAKEIPRYDGNSLDVDVRSLAALLREVERKALERAAAAVEIIGLRYRSQHDPSSENIADECETTIRALAAPGQENVP